MLCKTDAKANTDKETDKTDFAKPVENLKLVGMMYLYNLLGDILFHLLQDQNE